MATRQLLIVAIVLVGSAGGAAAQEPASRAAELASRQAEKATALHPEQQNWIERRILAAEDSGGLLVPRGFLVSFGGIKTGSGIAPGVGYGRLLDNGALVQAKVGYSIRNFKLAEIRYLSQAVAGGRLRFSTRARWQDAPSLPFYALGTQPSRLRADYSETKTEISAGADFRPVRLLQFGGTVGVERFDTGPGGSSKPRIATLFPDVPGNDADPDYLHTSASAAIDSRSSPGYTRSGSLLRATLHDYHQRSGSAYAFQRMDGVAEQYLPILHGNSVLYAGLHVSTTTASQGSEVPFFLMPYVGGTDLRGYENYRFRGRHSIAFTAEYRWYAQEYLDAAIFYDAGKAVSRRADLDFSGLESDVGAGVRLHGPSQTVLRLEAARGREGVRFVIGFTAVGG